jgi:hypothetical protein
MVFFAISRQSYLDYLALNVADTPLWVTCDVLSEQELSALQDGNAPVSVFNFSLSLDDVLGRESAIETIREHHPGQTIWCGV